MDEPNTPASAATILREFAGWLRHPRMLTPTGLRAPGTARRLLVLALFQIAVLIAILLPLITFWQAAFELPTPEAFGQIPPALLVPVAVLIAPVLEEILFRGWLTGRTRALWLVGCAIGLGALLYTSTQGYPLVAGIGIAGLLAAAPIGWLILRKRGTPAWFAASFPALFVLSAAAFSLSHMVNYPYFSAAALPLVLPQLWGALVWSFIRMRIGVAAAILAHAAANSAALVVAMLAG